MPSSPRARTPRTCSLRQGSTTSSTFGSTGSWQRGEHLEGKPAPDTFLAAARALSVPAAEAAVFEDALAGVAAGRAGHFGLVVGVDRVGQAEALREHGADVVVSDLAELIDTA